MIFVPYEFVYLYIFYSWHENSVEIGIIDLIKDRENRYKRERRKEKKRKKHFENENENKNR